MCSIRLQKKAKQENVQMMKKITKEPSSTRPKFSYFVIKKFISVFTSVVTDPTGARSFLCEGECDSSKAVIPPFLLFTHCPVLERPFVYRDALSTNLQLSLSCLLSGHQLVLRTAQ